MHCTFHRCRECRHIFFCFSIDGVPVKFFQVLDTLELRIISACFYIALNLFRYFVVNQSVKLLFSCWTMFDKLIKHSVELFVSKGGFNTKLCSNVLLISAAIEVKSDWSA